jgi:hypothetical protein
MALEKGSPLVECVNLALQEMKDDGCAQRNPPEGARGQGRRATDRGPTALARVTATASGLARVTTAVPAARPLPGKWRTVVCGSDVRQTSRRPRRDRGRLMADR